MPKYSIYPLTYNHVDEAAAVYSAAFFNDPMFVRMFPHKSKRMNSLKIFFRANVKYSIGREGRCVIGSPMEGVAIWNPPEGSQSLSGLFLV